MQTYVNDGQKWNANNSNKVLIKKTNTYQVKGDLPHLACMVREAYIINEAVTYNEQNINT